MLALVRLKKLSNSRNNGLLDGLAKLGFRDLLHLLENHGGDFLRAESLILTKVVNLDERRSILLDNGEGPVGHILQNE